MICCALTPKRVNWPDRALSWSAGASLIVSSSIPVKPLIDFAWAVQKAAARYAAIDREHVERLLENAEVVVCAVLAALRPEYPFHAWGEW